MKRSMEKKSILMIENNVAKTLGMSKKLSISQKSKIFWNEGFSRQNEGLWILIRFLIISCENIFES